MQTQILFSAVECIAKVNKQPGTGKNIIRNNIIALLLHKVLDLNMTPGVFNLKYLSFYWVKIQK